MRKKFPFHPTVFIVAMVLPAMASAASAPKAGSKAGSKAVPIVEQTDITWSAATGLGYDSNAYQAPRAPYVDQALATPALVTPQEKSGFFVPYEMKVDAAKSRSQNNRLLGSAKADGSFYIGGGLSNANEYNVRLNGGYEHILGRKEKSENTLYAGALLGKHKQVYVDHDSGLGKTTTVSGRDISDLYSYTSIGAEAEYKHRTGKIDYGFGGKYISYDYETVTGSPQQDHTYYKLGADASFAVAAQTRLSVSFDHSVRDYSYRHARDLQAAFTNTLLVYSYDALGVSLRNRISDEWLLYLDLDNTQRADNNAGYGDYSENRYGARVIYEKDRLKTRLSLHHWGRDYPKAFAFDTPGQAAKTYSGNDLRFKAELEQARNTALWAELVYLSQKTTDLRYDYVRTQAMAGMSWAY
ncbi:MAG: hypothetical protein OEV15_03660 [Gallionella sp.]|nr:hypothetical protein [Gallionella sp.]